VESDAERYGASQINDRYRDKYGAGMDEGVAGWAAVKFVAEAAAAKTADRQSRHDCLRI